MPFTMDVIEGEGTSMLKLSREGTEKGLPAVPLAEGGESPVEDGDIACVWRRNSCVGDEGQTLMRRESAAQCSTERESRVGSRGIELVGGSFDGETSEQAGSSRVSCRTGRAGQGRQVRPVVAGSSVRPTRLFKSSTRGRDCQATFELIEEAFSPVTWE